MVAKNASKDVMEAPSSTPTSSPHGSSDHEVVATRAFHAPRELVFRM